MKKYIVWGVIIGILLSIINSAISGIPGIFIFLIPAWIPLVSNCAGESCWGPMFLIGDFLFFIFSLLIALSIGYFKTKSV